MRVFPLLLALIWSGLALPVRAAAPIMEAEALGLTAQLPTEWALADIPGQPYRVGTGPTEGVFRVNVLFQGPEEADSLDAYSQAALRRFKEKIPGFRQIDVVDFKTEQGRIMKKVIAETHPGNPAWQSFYFGPSSQGKYFTMVGSAPLSTGRVHQNTFDDIARSIVITEPEKPDAKDETNGDSKEE